MDNQLCTIGRYATIVARGEGEARRCGGQADVEVRGHLGEGGGMREALGHRGGGEGGEHKFFDGGDEQEAQP